METFDAKRERFARIEIETVIFHCWKVFRYAIKQIHIVILVQTGRVTRRFFSFN